MSCLFSEIAILSSKNLMEQHLMNEQGNHLKTKK